MTLQSLSRTRDVLTSGGVAGEPWEVHEAPSTLSLTMRKPPSPLLWSWVLRKGRKSFLSAGKAVTQGQPGERRCPRLSRDFVTDSEAPGSAQFVLGYKMNPAEPVPGSLCSCLAAQASHACWICLLLPCSLPP